MIIEKWRTGTYCDLEKFTEYYDRKRCKKRFKWVKYIYVYCSICNKRYLRVKHSKSKRYYCSDKCRSKAIKLFYNNFDHMSYKSGSYIDSNGYVLIKDKLHLRTDGNGYVREHILVVEKRLGRFLEKNKDVHHLNHIRNDNRIENLIVLSRSEHVHLHKQKIIIYT